MNVEEISVNLQKLQARSQGDEIMLDVSNPTITPCEETVFLRYDLGDPFGTDYRFLRIPISVHDEPLHDFVKFWNTSEFTLSESSLSVKFQESDDMPVQREEIDCLISVNGYDAAISRLPMSCEYQFEQNPSTSQEQLQSRLKTLRAARRKLSEQDPVTIAEKPEYTGGDTIKLCIDVGGSEPIPFNFSVPKPQEIGKSEVIEFINRIGSGSIEDLHGNTAYLTLNRGIGTDEWFNRYSLAIEPEEENAKQATSYTGKAKLLLFGK